MHQPSASKAAEIDPARIAALLNREEALEERARRLKPAQPGGSHARNPPTRQREHRPARPRRSPRVRIAPGGQSSLLRSRCRETLTCAPGAPGRTFPTLGGIEDDRSLAVVAAPARGGCS